MLPIVEVSTDFRQEEVQKVLSRRMTEDKKVAQVVHEIIADVRKDGDKALYEYTKKFDEADLSDTGFRVEKEEIKQAYKEVDKQLVDALRLAKERITTYHEEQGVTSCVIRERDLKLEQLALPLNRVGIYVPGGRAAYPSSVLMNAIPAKVAGVNEIVMCVPPSADGEVDPKVLVAASEVEIDEIYKLGGAQAVAALAYGTKTVKRVDKIVGPGNVYVTLAKKLVVGAVDIDMLAGPSEVLIIADERAKPSYIAVDMLAQAEHDPRATALLVTTSAALAAEVNAELKVQLENLNRKEIARAALKSQGAIFVVESVDVAIKLANRIAPEHLELMIPSAEQLLDRIKNAGAIFIGSFTPEAVGDYIAGPSHVLPTEGTSRFHSPLNVLDFIKFSSVIHFTREGFLRLGKAAQIIAEAEGLDAHANSIKIRLENNDSL